MLSNTSVLWRNAQEVFDVEVLRVCQEAAVPELSKQDSQSPASINSLRGYFCRDATTSKEVMNMRPYLCCFCSIVAAINMRKPLNIINKY